MKWRVERPIQEMSDKSGPMYAVVGPDIVEARYVEVETTGSLLVYGDFAVPIKIYAPGQWTTVERVEDE